jgi:hypothetical protein
LPETIAQGTILIRGDALLPRSMNAETQPYSKSWTRATVERSVLDRQIKDAGWSFFYLAGELKGSAFGSGDVAAKRALTRILNDLDPDRYNCLEVTSEKSTTFLGMTFVTVTAHSRHIQENSRMMAPRWPATAGRAKRGA